MTPFVAEFIGTALIIIIGNGVVANVVLPKTKGNNGGLISIVLPFVARLDCLHNQLDLVLLAFAAFGGEPKVLFTLKF